jgi:hypothetical protein
VSLTPWLRRTFKRDHEYPTVFRMSGDTCVALVKHTPEGFVGMVLPDASHKHRLESGYPAASEADVRDWCDRLLAELGFKDPAQPAPPPDAR